MFVRFLILACIVVFSTMGFAHARVVTDQEQPVVDIGANPHAIHGDSEQKLAQTFTVGVTGELVGLRLPTIECNDSHLVISIHKQDDGKPTGELLTTRTFSASDIRSVGSTLFRDFLFYSPLDVGPGDELAFTIDTIGDGNSCGYLRAPVGDTYPRGEMFFDARPNLPGWQTNDDIPNSPRDLAFFTLMAGGIIAPGRDNCIAADGQVLPFSRDVPACRCFEDRILLEMRCGLLHPDFFISRNFPSPFEAGRPFEQVWEFHPLKDLDGPVRVYISGGGLTNATEFVFASKGGNSGPESFVVKGVAPEAGQTIDGLAVIIYDMKDAQSEYFQKFGVDTSVTTAAIIKPPVLQEFPVIIPPEIGDKIPDEIKDAQPDILQPWKGD